MLKSFVLDDRISFVGVSPCKILCIFLSNLAETPNIILQFSSSVSLNLTINVKKPIKRLHFCLLLRSLRQSRPVSPCICQPTRSESQSVHHLNRQPNVTVGANSNNNKKKKRPTPTGKTLSQYGTAGNGRDLCAVCLVCAK